MRQAAQGHPGHPWQPWHPHLWWLVVLMWSTCRYGSKLALNIPSTVVCHSVVPQYSRGTGPHRASHISSSTIEIGLGKSFLSVLPVLGAPGST